MADQDLNVPRRMSAVQLLDALALVQSESSEDCTFPPRFPPGMPHPNSSTTHCDDDPAEQYEHVVEEDSSAPRSLERNQVQSTGLSLEWNHANPSADGNYSSSSTSSGSLPEGENNVRRSPLSARRDVTTDTTNKPSIENISEDISALIFSHLTLVEIARVSLLSSSLNQACRSNPLWRFLFRRRWNVESQIDSEPKIGENQDYTFNDPKWDDFDKYYQAYRIAYSYPHDLWITHWNCVPPRDGLAPGRCCIRPVSIPHKSKTRKASLTHTQRKQRDTDPTRSKPLRKPAVLVACPDCRNWDNLASTRLKRKGEVKDDSKYEASSFPKTPAQAMALVTALTRRNYIERGLTSLQNHTASDHKSTEAAERQNIDASRTAFDCAGTFHRQINARQFESHRGPANFSMDALFFTMVDPLSVHGQLELEREAVLLRDASACTAHSTAGQDSHDTSFTSSTRNNTATGTNPLHETSRHSWHVLKLTNPDFYRPQVFQIAVQRPDCFGVYPSEGYIPPGGSVFVTLSVRPLGSALAHAYESLNVQREGLDAAWAQEGMYAAGSGNPLPHEYLPMTPFLVRYQFANGPPGKSDAVYNEDYVNSQNNENVRHQRRRTMPPTLPVAAAETSLDNCRPNSIIQEKSWMLDHHWNVPVPASQVRSISISAHVHSHYTFADFMRQTCSRWRSNDDCDGSGPWFMAPALRELDGLDRDEHNSPLLSSILDLPLNTHSSRKMTSQHRAINNWQQQQLQHRLMKETLSEGPCISCGERWGLLQEELFQAHLIATSESMIEASKRQLVVSNIELCMDLLPSHPIFQRQDVGQGRVLQADVSTAKEQSQIATLLYTMTVILQSYSAFSWTTRSQKEAMLRMEAGIDRIYRGVAMIPRDPTTACGRGSEKKDDEGGWIPWREAGLYRHALSTHSAFGGNGCEPVWRMECNCHDFGVVSWKDEPTYLESFRTLEHNPGVFSLGPQEDVKRVMIHQGRQPQNEHHQRHGVPVLDMFQDDPISALKAAICMIYDPRPLLVHGIYDRIPYPGVLVRRPRLHSSVLFQLALDSGQIEEVASDESSSLPLMNIIQDLLMSHRLRHELHNAYDLFLSIEKKDLRRERVTKHRSGSKFVDCDLNEAGKRRDTISRSLENYIYGVPPPGVGRFALSKTHDGQISSLIESNSAVGQVTVPDATDDTTQTINNANEEAQELLLPVARDRRSIFTLLWSLGAQMGLAVVDNPEVSTIFMNRRILIALQWVGVFLMVTPLCLTLIARSIALIPTHPVEYDLKGLPFTVGNEMRFLSESECWIALLLVIVVGLAAGRFGERHLGRDYFRAMQEQIPLGESEEANCTKSLICKKITRKVINISACISYYFQRSWDYCCPSILQQHIYSPCWNRRTREKLLRHIAYWRNQKVNENGLNNARASTRRGFEVEDVFSSGWNGMNSYPSFWKILVGCAVTVGSFCASSPHFWLNLITAYSCSISLGMSISIQAIEKGRPGLNFSNPGSAIRSSSMGTIVTLSFLVGNLVGSSGGTMFLVEFIVTSIMLVFGGGGAISSNTMESWGCFFCLGSASFWGYLFGRTAVMDSCRRKRGGLSSMLLVFAVVALLLVWFVVFSFAQWDSPLTLLLLRPKLTPRSPESQQLASKLLQ